MEIILTIIQIIAALILLYALYETLTAIIRNIGVELLNPAIVQQNLDNPDFVFIDIRPPLEFAEGHIENVQNIPLAKLEQVYESLPAEKTIVVICGIGKRSVKAYKFLKSKNFANVRKLKGGMILWKLFGFKVIRDN